MSLEFDEKLLGCYVQCQALYDKSCGSYKDKFHRENLWKSIASAMDLSVEQCENRIKQLRERYTKEKRLAATVSGQAALAGGKLWPLFHMCSFWDDHIRPRKTIGSVRAQEPLSANNEFVEAQEGLAFSVSPPQFLAEEELLFQFSPEQQPSVSRLSSTSETSLRLPCSAESSLASSSRPPSSLSAASIATKKRKSSECNFLEMKMAKMADAAAELAKQVANPVEEDVDASFANFMKAELRKMKDGDIKDTFKLEVCAMLMKAQMDCRKQN